MNTDVVLKVFLCIPIIVGAIMCFAGHKVMKTVLVILSFMVGAMLGVLIGVSANTVLGVISVIVFGVGLAVLAYNLYHIGIFVLIVFLTTVATYMICREIIISVLVGFLVGVLAVFLEKPVIIISTSFAGAGIILSSALYMAGFMLTDALVVSAVLWIVMALAGMVCQYFTTPDEVPEYTTAYRSFSEKKYPGMQRAYRNFCIMCGFEMNGSSDECPRCGFSYKS